MKECENTHTIWSLRENESNEKVLSDLIEIHIIDMSKAEEEYKKDKNNKLAEWIMFILDPNTQEVKSIMEENKEIKKTAEKLKDLSDNYIVTTREEILARWEMEEKWNKQSLIEYGKKMAKEEAQKEIIKNMLENSIDIEEISKFTGLSKEEINKLLD